MRNSMFQKKPKTTSPEVSQGNQSQSAQAVPPNPNNNLNWKHVKDELPQCYSLIHIWDGKTVYRDWARVWSESMGNIYVNNINDKIITKITHWTAPENQTYPKYEPLTEDDIKLFTKRDIKFTIKAIYHLITQQEKSKHPSSDYVAGVDDAIITLEKLLKSKRMTGKKKGT